MEFWETHDSAEYWEEMEEASFEVELQQNLLHSTLAILTYRPERCPRCHHALEDVTIEYVGWHKGHLTVIRDVPAFRCQPGEHEYILEQTYDEIERLLVLEATQKLQPTEMIQVPVFSLKVEV